MSALSEARAELVADLRELIDVTVEDHVPEYFTPPMVVIDWGDPMLDAGATFAGELTAHLDVFAIVPLTVNDATTAGLEDLVVQVIACRGDWGLAQVSAPYVVTASQDQNTRYLTARIQLQQTLQL